MMTEELITHSDAPLTLELEYADDSELQSLFDIAPLADETATETGDATAVTTDKQASKKDQILALHKAGTTDVAEIVRLTGVRPSYVAQVLQNAGHLNGYFDLYTTTGREHNVYGRFFRNVLSFKTTEAARESVKKLDRLYTYFERLGDRAGQHQAMVLALTGKNRARWSGKPEAAEVFGEWLDSH